MPVRRTREQMRASVNNKALDYAWACRNGQLYCMNTHGLPGDQSDQWTIVHNTDNCAGTYKPNCGAPAPLFLPNRTKQPGTSIYDYIVMVAQNGQVKYYGAMVEGVEEVLLPITPDMYHALTGLPTSYSGDGIRRIRRPQLFGNDLIKYNYRLADKYGMNHVQVDKMAKYLQRTQKRIGLTNQLASLNAKGVPVADQNNMFEVFAKYLKFNPDTANWLPNNIFHDFSLLSTQARGNHLQERSGGGFNFADMFEQGMEILEGLFTAGTAEEDRRTMQTWMNEYALWMDTDFNDLEREKIEFGPQHALDTFIRLKGSNWKIMKDRVTTWCSEKGYPIPSFWTEWWNFQNDYESDLRRLAAGSSGSGDAPPGEFGPGSNKPGGNTPGGSNTPGKGMDLSTVGLVIGALVLAMLIAK